MKTMRNLIAMLALVSCLCGGLQAQENFELGKMWTFEHVPHDYFMKEHGFELTQGWLDAVRLSSLRYGGGCSASFVSPKGLIMTNHHCARGDIDKVSPAGEDWMKNGYVAKTMRDEVKLPGLVVKQMVASTDVTARMNEGIEVGESDESVVSKRAANEQKILAEAREKNPDHECSITALYHGGLYMLYEYRVFTDLRLVASPHLQTAHFGGDPDNFTYPRFGIDFTFVRAYVDDVPFDSSAHYFKFKPEGALEGESVFIPGNPGSTERLMTHAQLEYDRDTYLPIIREHINILIAYLHARVAANPETEQSLKPQMLRFENGRKAYGGYHASLLDESLMAQKVEAEKAFREKIAANDALQGKYGDAWDQIDAITDELAIAMRAGRVYRNLDIPLIGRALQVVMATSPDTPESVRERIKGQIQGGDLPALDGPEMLRASMWLDHARKWKLEDDSYVSKMYPEMASADAIAKLYAESELDSGDTMKQMLEAGADAVSRSNDPAIVLGRELVAGQKKFQGKVQALQTRLKVQRARIGQAVYDVYGTSVSPDATGTPRISDGKVAGYPMNGTIAPWKTSFYGLYARNVEFEDEYPFNLPQIWKDRMSKVDMTKPVDFVSTNDIIGGNSGSAVINKNREAVGLVFDGNIEMLGNRYLYKQDIPRSVSVHVAAILESLGKVYDADRVLNELLGK